MTNATAIQTLDALVVGPEENRAPRPLQMPGHEVIIKLSGKDSGGNYAVGLLKAGPMSGPPLHIHSREDEWFYVLKGELTFQVGEERITAGPGTSVFAPRNIAHTWQNLTDQTVEALGMITPPQFEGFFLDATEGAFDPARMGALAEKYGVTMVGPPITK